MQELLERKQGLHRTVLIVDDELIEREMLGAMLNESYEVIYASNGVSALEIIKHEKTSLSIILLDLHMPKLDGYSLLKILRSDSELWRIPVIVLTSEKNAEVKSLQLGAADFISKPYEVPEIIRARIEHSIELSEDRIIIHETERDVLTGLFNKEFFFEYGRRLDNQNKNMPMDALVLDINRFHIINELYGRAYGDTLLKKLGNSIHNLVCEIGGLACRRNSNCFGIYIPHMDNPKDHISRFISMIEDVLDDRKISIRLGIYSDDGSDLDMEQRFERAELVCRKIKNHYTTCFDIYNAELHSKELHSERLINDMDSALLEKQFKVFYQPKYNICDGKPVLTSVEALVRWFHPEFGMIPPGEFITLFEDNGLIRQLDKYVWNEAANQIKKWKEEGFNVPVSVNVSRVDVFNPRLVDILSDIIKNSEIDSENLLLEITESAYSDNAQQIINTVMNLRENGFKIEMDDFGSGYSSLNMLCSLPIDALKLDMEFIRNICDNKKHFRLVGIMIDIARILEVPVIAEGVETKEQLDLLEDLGCDIIQGYYFSKPLPAEELTALLKSEVRSV
ncbi:EAL domain-containing response regulator [Ruminococcus sp.]|uniref:putative bifunctional diguanylate cyclase/phosphodiesterase n=1 Tax=Ruminococcus sp. TaxID=41978 RepID=UPI001B498640|nr:EAL domain-containing response regulator [Ruminococcus sp.]MBP5431683.1 EAL domain-containing protein [Ruminococcus sp.]